MRLLLDTHALLWWWTDDAGLSAAARSAIADEADEVCVSAASAWEVATKHRLGKLTEVPQAAPRFAELVAADGFALLPIAQHHALKAGAYPHEHRDPFGRMLAAQSDDPDCWLRSGHQRRTADPRTGKQLARAIESQAKGGDPEALRARH